MSASSSAGNPPRRPGWGAARASVELANRGERGWAEGRHWLSGQTAGTLLEPSTLRKLEQLRLVGRRRVASFARGERRSLHRGTSTEFLDYRPYTPGDDVARVDWTVYGRLDSLVVRLFEDEQRASVHLLLDNSRSMDWGQPNKLTLATQLAGALGYVALRGFDQLRCAAFSDVVNARFGPTAAPHAAPELFRFLAGLKAVGATDFNAALRRYAAQHQQPGLVLIVSDLLSREGFEAGLSALLARGYEVVLLHILAPEEVRPAIGGDLRLVDRETGAGVDITLNQRAVNLYRERYRAWTARVEAFAARQGVVYERFESSLPLERLLLGSLRRRGVLA